MAAFSPEEQVTLLNHEAEMKDHEGKHLEAGLYRVMAGNVLHLAECKPVHKNALGTWICERCGVDMSTLSPLAECPGPFTSNPE